MIKKRRKLICINGHDISVCGRDKENKCLICKTEHNKEYEERKNNIPRLTKIGKVIDLTGVKKGKLLAISLISSGGRGKHAKWLCICDCGNKVIVESWKFRFNLKYNSCGCSKYDRFVRNDFESALHEFYSGYKFEAKHRSLVFDLPISEFEVIIQQNCTYCGSEPSLIIKSKKKSQKEFLFNGIDRIDSNIGYIKTNVVSCCKRCNYMKRNFTVKDFLNHIKLIMKYQEKLNAFAD